MGSAGSHPRRHQEHLIVTPSQTPPNKWSVTQNDPARSDLSSSSEEHPAELAELFETVSAASESVEGLPTAEEGESRKSPHVEEQEVPRTIENVQQKPSEVRPEELPGQLQQLEETLTSLGLGGLGVLAADSLHGGGSGSGGGHRLRRRQNKVPSNDSTAAAAGGGRRRSQLFSWQMKNSRQKQNGAEEDNWSYNVENIEGFDIRKFREANKAVPGDDSLKFISESENGSTQKSSESSARYDLQDQRLLAAIERDFEHQMSAL